MTEPWKQERPEDATNPIDMLVTHFNFSQTEAENIQARRRYSLEDLQKWFRYRRVAFKAESVKCPDGYVRWKMAEFVSPDQTRDPWWHGAGLKKDKRPSYDQKYEGGENPEAMSWQQFKKVSKRRYRGGKKEDSLEP